jgi:hypothetical protein
MKAFVDHNKVVTVNMLCHCFCFLNIEFNNVVQELLVRITFSASAVWEFAVWIPCKHMAYSSNIS